MIVKFPMFVCDTYESPLKSCEERTLNMQFDDCKDAHYLLSTLINGGATKCVSDGDPKTSLINCKIVFPKKESNGKIALPK